MPSLSQTRSTRSRSARSPRFARQAPRTIFLLTLGLYLVACASGPGSGSTTPPPPPQITVTLAPNSGTVLLGNTLPFSATVTNTSDTSVFWSVNGIAGGAPQFGTVSPDGLFTAPADLPAGGKVQITATSRADSSKSSAASVNISSDISVSLSPPSSSVELGALQSFHASITSSGKPGPAIHWSLSGPACPNNCGAVDANGNYTALVILPSATAVTLTATSVADPSKQNSVPLTITSHFTLQLVAPSSLQPGATGIFGAHVVAVDAASGAVIAGTLGGWSCQAPGPSKFDGTYQIGALAVNQSYKIYVEPLSGAVGPAEVSNALVSLCRNTTTDPGWPPLQSCVVPNPTLEFTTATRSSL